MVEFKGEKCTSFPLFFVLVFSIELVWWIFCKLLIFLEFSLLFNFHLILLAHQQIDWHSFF